MARKTAEFTATQGRDKGKTYVLTEMSSYAAERWAIRAFMALAKSGVDVPEDVQELGMAGIARLGLKALGGANFEDAEPLLEEMFQCVKFKASAAVRDLVEDDIEEVATRLQLRREVFGLHVDFSTPVEG